jgi:hypothetical protein
MTATWKPTRISFPQRLILRTLQSGGTLRYTGEERYVLTKADGERSVQRVTRPMILAMLGAGVIVERQVCEGYYEYHLTGEGRSR